MSRLFERINESSQALKEDYNFSSGMKSLFSNSFQGVRDIADLPLEPKQSEWTEISGEGRTSLNRSFFFDRHSHLRYFVSEVLKESESMNHHPVLVVASDRVDVELYTHDINDISSLDLKLSNFIDEIYSDVKFIVEF